MQKLLRHLQRKCGGDVFLGEGVLEATADRVTERVNNLRQRLSSTMDYWKAWSDAVEAKFGARPTSTWEKPPPRTPPSPIADMAQFPEARHLCAPGTAVSAEQVT